MTREESGWLSARAHMMCDPTVINLNTGSFGPTPRPVFERAIALRSQLAAEPMDFILRRQPDLLWQAREALARFLGGEPRRLVFTANVTAAINTVASSLRLAGPGEILLTDHEYGAMHWCWERTAQRQGLTLRTVALPILSREPEEIVEAFRAGINERTRLVFFSHVLSPTGLVLPAREICALARRHGATTVVDGAHAVAMIPLDLESVGADFYGGNCHKWLLAPIGSGFLYIGRGNEDRLQPMQVSWGWHRDHARPDERNAWGATHRTWFLEHEGVRDLCPWLAVPDAISFQESIGLDGIRQRIALLAAQARQKLSATPGLSPATPAAPGLHGAMTAFRLPGGTDLTRLRQNLWDPHRIEVALVERGEGDLIRISTHFYNTAEEIDRLAAVLPEALSRSC
jgi:isopenicillin-N epimerase